MSTALVTGAGGFIGSHVAEQLALQGWDVHGVDDLSGGVEENLLDSFDWWIGDCVDVDLMTKLVDGVDVIVHCAANAREGASQFQPASVAYRNLYAFSRVVSAGIAAGVKNYVIYSSMAVYGGQ